MNLIASAPLWLILLLIAAVLAAAIEDAARLRISNVTCAVVALGAIAAMIIAGPSFALWQNFALCAIVLGLGTVAFSAGLFGGGDIKLIAAAGLWLDLRGGMLLVSAILLAGGIVALAYIAARIIRGSPKGSIKSRRVPYGIAIALGTLISIALIREQHPAAPQHYTLPAARR